MPYIETLPFDLKLRDAKSLRVVTCTLLVLTLLTLDGFGSGATVLAQTNVTSVVRDDTEKIALGRAVFGRCQACHQIGYGAETVGTQYGPQLNGIVGRRAGSLYTYKYSVAMDTADFIWTRAKLARYLDKPRREVVGTSMAFAGIKDSEDVDNLIAYLAQFDLLIDEAPRPRLRPANL